MKRDNKTIRLAIGFGTVACGLVMMAVFQTQGKAVGLSDAQLVQATHDRAKFTRITAEPVRMDYATAFLCNEPDEDLAVRKKGLSEKNPHRENYVHVFTSTNAVEAMQSRTNTFPQGSLILKEKLSYIGGQHTELFTGMLKREPGYNPECGDWEFFTVSADAKKVTSRGKLQQCMDCHVEYAERDFVTKSYVYFGAKKSDK